MDRPAAAKDKALRIIGSLLVVSCDKMKVLVKQVEVGRTLTPTVEILLGSRNAAKERIIGSQRHSLSSRTQGIVGTSISCLGTGRRGKHLSDLRNMLHNKLCKEKRVNEKHRNLRQSY